VEIIKFYFSIKQKNRGELVNIYFYALTFVCVMFNILFCSLLIFYYRFIFWVKLKKYTVVVTCECCFCSSSKKLPIAPFIICTLPDLFLKLFADGLTSIQFTNVNISKSIALDRNKLINQFEHIMSSDQSRSKINFFNQLNEKHAQQQLKNVFSNNWEQIKSAEQNKK
jgi:hypothetical protein